MLLRLVPLLAVFITLAALLSTSGWQPHPRDGLNAPAHVVGGLY